MSTVENKAVFLSYASQDAEAARRICEALRAAVVEVWFDQSELRGGDAWDQKIRKQIKECALFVPVISAATQARREGYFRLEWRLADQRTHLMSHDRAFLLPVVIDDTADQNARVPESFLALQWTRLPGGVSTVAFSSHVRALLELDAEVARDAADSEPRRDTGASLPSGKLAPRRPRKRAPLIAIAALLLVGIGAAVWQRDGSSKTAAERGSVVGKTAVSPTEDGARGRSLVRPEVVEFIARARAFCRKTDVVRADLDAAVGLVDRAVKLDPTNAEAWATRALVDCRYVTEGLDRSPARVDAARQHARQAMGFDSASSTARFAQASALVLANNNPSSREAALKLLAPLATDPGVDADVLLALSSLERGNPDRALEYLTRAAQVREAAGRAHFARAKLHFFEKRFQAAADAIDEAIGAEPAALFLLWKAYLQQIWEGDPSAAARTVAQIPSELLIEDFAMSARYSFQLCAGDHDGALATIRAFPRDYIESGASSGPTGYFKGYVLARAGKPNAAEIEWRAARDVVERRLASQPNDRTLLVFKALLLVSLGDRPAAETIWRSTRELFGDEADDWADHRLRLELLPDDAVLDYLVDQMERARVWALAGNLRVDPYLDRLRSNPRFVELLARAEADPHLSPRAKAKSASGGAGRVADPKSVVVLPFANLSGDPAQEYFSDGLTEEIRDALARERDLRVVARTSAFSFKDKKATVPEIARALNVTQVVEGTVRREGNRVRITCTLTRVAGGDGQSETLGNFTEELSDIFGLQEKVAGVVVEKITRRRAGVETVGSTRNAAAYDAYLRGSAARNDYSNRSDAVAHFETAVRLDPGYALAWARLAQELMRQRQRGVAFRTRENAVRARTAAATALRLGPTLPEAYLANAMVSQAVDRDLDAASRALETVERLQAADAEVWTARADIAFCRGDWGSDLVRLVWQAVDGDPKNLGQHVAHASQLSVAGWFSDADQLLRRVLEIAPDSESSLRFHADNTVRWTGDVSAALRALDRFPADQRGDQFHATRAELHLQRGDLAAAFDEFQRVRPSAGELVQQGTGLRHSFSYRLAVLASRLGHAARAKEFFDQALRDAETMAGDATTARIAVPALVKARLGQRAEALALMEQAMQKSKGFFANNVIYIRQSKAEMHVVLGQMDEAIATLRTIHEKGFGLGYSLRLDADWEPLRGHPEFQALMNEAEARAKAQPGPKNK